MRSAASWPCAAPGGPAVGSDGCGTASRGGTAGGGGFGAVSGAFKLAGTCNVSSGSTGARGPEPPGCGGGKCISVLEGGVGKCNGRQARTSPSPIDPKARPITWTEQLAHLLWARLDGFHAVPLGEACALYQFGVAAARSRSLQNHAGGSPRCMAPFFLHGVPNVACHSCSVLAELAVRKLCGDRSWPTLSS
jgi:hypothetical protein